MVYSHRDATYVLHGRCQLSCPANRRASDPITWCSLGIQLDLDTLDKCIDEVASVEMVEKNDIAYCYSSSSFTIDRCKLDPAMGVRFPSQESMGYNSNVLDILYFTLLVASPESLVKASVVGSILQSFVCGVVTVLVGVLDNLPPITHQVTHSAM